MALVGAVTTLNSCNNDDPVPPPPIVGTWSRVEYEWKELPTGFTKYWEGYTLDSWGETGYNLSIKADNTYSRQFTLPSPNAINDKGSWTLDGTRLVFKPDDPDDLDAIEAAGVVGLDFTVEGEVSDIRMVISQVIKLELPTDAAIDAADGDLSQIPDSEWKAIDVKVHYKFNKLN